MEYLDKEVNFNEEFQIAQTGNSLSDLTDLQLALVGGGVGEIAVG